MRHKRPAEVCQNIYIMTAVARWPRQIAGFDVALDKTAERIQALVDRTPSAETYYTDAYSAYEDVTYFGTHVQGKNDTFTVESVNADLRHYIPLLNCLLDERNLCNLLGIL